MMIIPLPTKPSAWTLIDTDRKTNIPKVKDGYILSDIRM